MRLFSFPRALSAPKRNVLALLSECRQENVEVMLANIDKAEVLENKAAALSAQAKT